MALVRKAENDIKDIILAYQPVSTASQLLCWWILPLLALMSRGQKAVATMIYGAGGKESATAKVDPYPEQNPERKIPAI
jgi:hypothetical protein